MSSTLSVTTALSGTQYQITASLAAGSALPPAVFMYQNLGTTALGPYVGVASLQELTRYQVFTGSVIPVFGNLYVLYPTLQTTLPSGSDPKVFVANTVSVLQSLSTAYQTLKSVTQQFTIT